LKAGILESKNTVTELDRFFLTKLNSTSRGPNSAAREKPNGWTFLQENKVACKAKVKEKDEGRNMVTALHKRTLLFIIEALRAFTVRCEWAYISSLLSEKLVYSP